MANVSKRPGVVLAAAILVLIFGSFSVLGGCCGVIGGVLQDSLQKMVPEPPAVQGKKPINVNRELDKEVPSKFYVDTSFNVFNLLLGLVKIFAGIGLLKMASSARVITFIVAGVTIFATVACNVYNVIFVIPVFDRLFAEQLRNAPPMPVDFSQLMQGGMWMGVAFGIIFTLAIWLTVVFLLSGQRVRAAFAEAAAGPPADEDKPRSRYEGYDDEDDQPPPPKSPGDTGITDRS